MPTAGRWQADIPAPHLVTGPSAGAHTHDVRVLVGAGRGPEEAEEREEAEQLPSPTHVCPFLNGEARRPAGRPLRVRTNERRGSHQRDAATADNPHIDFVMYAVRVAASGDNTGGDARGCTDGHVSGMPERCIMYVSRGRRYAAVDRAGHLARRAARWRPRRPRVRRRALGRHFCV